MSHGKTPQSKVIDGILCKECQYCKKFKPLEQYYKNTRYFLGCQHWCKQCGSEYSKKRNTKEKNRAFTLRKYGLTLEQYAELYQKQDGKCAICLRDFKLLNVDHDHKDGKIRGLLCENCNKGLGYFEDDLTIMANAFNYLLMFEF